MKTLPTHFGRLILRCLALALLVAGCGREDAGPSVEDTLARERVAAAFRLAEYDHARRALEPLLERDSVEVEDLLRRVNIELEDSRSQAARPFLERARDAAPDDPGVLWSTYRIERANVEFERATEALERLHALVPDDYPTRLALANMLDELGRDEQAEEHYRALLASETTPGPGWRLSTTYRLFNFLQRRGRVEEALRYQADLQRFEEEGVARLGTTDLERGTFGDIPPPARGEIASPSEWASWMGSETVTGHLDAALEAELSDCVGVSPVTLNDHWSWTEALWGKTWLRAEQALREDPTEKSLLLKRVDRMPLDLLAWGHSGLQVARFADGEPNVQTIFDEPVTFAAALDLDLPGSNGASDASKPERDGLLDFVVATERGLFVLGQRAGRWTAYEPPILESFPIADIDPVDFDHDGDLDLLVVGSEGLRLLRNDGFGAPGGSFTDTTVAAGLPRDRGFSWGLGEDPDADNDVDLILGGTGGVLLAKNERGGRFTASSQGLPDALRSDDEPLTADLNADGWIDFVARGKIFCGAPGLVWSEHESKELPEDTEQMCAGTPFGEARPRLLWPTADGTIEALELNAEPIPLGTVGGALDGRLHLADVTADSHADLIAPNGNGVRVCPTSGTGHTIALALQGVKDNRRAVGALLELRAGALYRRIYWRGEPQVIGLGSREEVDIVRVTWPNGIVQEIVDLELGSYVIRQREGLGGSCPFLYTWNGTSFEFVSDVLGITPLGLPMAPGQLVPPDHDEYVLVRGEQLRPKDGFFELQLTEELREVTYLDRVRLDVVDHPRGTEVYPNELFTFPPFPGAHIHTVRAPLAPHTALDGEGRDWSAALDAVDGDYAIPFEPLFGQFLGLTEEHTLELRFDPSAIGDASKLRLVMTGWFYWTDASVNMAAARHPEIAFAPPQLFVPDGEGGWRAAGPPMGFPAGKLKTMVVDVSDVLPREDPRLRISSTLQLYWDSIRLATDGDDAERIVHSVEPASAELWARGFSEPLSVMGISGMDWFEWDRLAPQPRWNQHPGLYTRYGETLPLLQQVDDRFVILGAGDALRIRFDAADVPPPRPGFVRDYLVYLDGWAKDRDPNTVEALYVEPLPFHGMKGYPYDPEDREESFPDDASHRDWRVQWNTRLSTRWLDSLVPR